MLIELGQPFTIAISWLTLRAAALKLITEETALFIRCTIQMVVEPPSMAIATSAPMANIILVLRLKRFNI
jgi:hypothetical protein